MNQRAVKLFFDVNLSRVLVLELLEFYRNDYPNLQIRHLTEFTRADASDPDWIAMLARESGEWIVLSADRGRNSVPTQKLPLICREHKIRHILLTGKLLSKGKLMHKQAIVSVWLDIVSFADRPPGSKATLGVGSGSGTRAAWKICS